jgi:hypothetical protein
VAIIGDGSAMTGCRRCGRGASQAADNLRNREQPQLLHPEGAAGVQRATDRFTGMDPRDPDIDFAGLARSLRRAGRARHRSAGHRPALRERCGPAARAIEVMVADGFGG